MSGPISPISSQSLSPSMGLGSVTPGGSSLGSTAAPKTSFSDVLKNAVGEVSQLQNDATSAVEQLSMGQTDDVVGVMSAVEKSELAFKTLLAIRTKLMTAYDEIRNMPI